MKHNYAPKPSDAVFAMVNGLRKQSKRKDFRIDMGTFGEADSGGICYGCAACCAIQELTGINLTADNISGRYNRTNALKLNPESLSAFENMIDDLRIGSWQHLARFYKTNMPVPDGKLPYLSTKHWKNDSGAYEAYAKKLKKAGL